MEQSYGFPSNFASNQCQTFACVTSEKKPSTNNGVATKFMASFYLSNIRKKYFLPKKELLQNLWQTFACVTSEFFLPNMELLQNL